MKWNHCKYTVVVFSAKKANSGCLNVFQKQMWIPLQLFKQWIILVCYVWWWIMRGAADGEAGAAVQMLEELRWETGAPRRWRRWFGDGVIWLTEERDRQLKEYWKGLWPEIWDGEWAGDWKEEFLRKKHICCCYWSWKQKLLQSIRYQSDWTFVLSQSNKEPELEV